MSLFQHSLLMPEAGAFLACLRSEYRFLTTSICWGVSLYRLRSQKSPREKFPRAISLLFEFFRADRKHILILGNDRKKHKSTAYKLIQLVMYLFQNTINQLHDLADFFVFNDGFCAYCDNVIKVAVEGNVCWLAFW